MALEEYFTKEGKYRALYVNDGVINYVWELTEGQPWLVNALGYVACFELKEGRDRSKPITKELITEAKEKIILERYTHIDQLADKLKEDRVQRVIEAILEGDKNPEDIPVDDILYVEDLGLIKTRPNLRISNKIYQEIIPRELTFSTQVTITHDALWYVNPDGSLDMVKLMRAFQEFLENTARAGLRDFNIKKQDHNYLCRHFCRGLLIVAGG